jgi:hypothetical protein
MAALFRLVYPNQISQEGAKGRADGNECQQGADAKAWTEVEQGALAQARPHAYGAIDRDTQQSAPKSTPEHRMTLIDSQEFAHRNVLSQHADSIFGNSQFFEFVDSALDALIAPKQADNRFHRRTSLVSLRKAFLMGPISLSWLTGYYGKALSVFALAQIARRTSTLPGQVPISCRHVNHQLVIL